MDNTFFDNDTFEVHKNQTEFDKYGVWVKKPPRSLEENTSLDEKQEESVADAILQDTVSRPKVTAKDVAEGTDAYVHHIKCGNSRVTIWEPGRIEIVTEEDDAATNTSKIEIDGKGNIKMSSTTQV